MNNNAAVERILHESLLPEALHLVSVGVSGPGQEVGVTRDQALTHPQTDSLRYTVLSRDSEPQTDSLRYTVLSRDSEPQTDSHRCTVLSRDSEPQTDSLRYTVLSRDSEQALIRPKLIPSGR
jgi:hypothetical protein